MPTLFKGLLINVLGNIMKEQVFTKLLFQIELSTDDLCVVLPNRNETIVLT